MLQIIKPGESSNEHVSGSSSGTQNATFVVENSDLDAVPVTDSSRAQTQLSHEKKSQLSSEEKSEIDSISSYETQLTLFLEGVEKGDVSDEQLLKLQNFLKTDVESASFTMRLILSQELTFEEKDVLVELLSARTDEMTINFAMELIQSSTKDAQLLGGELANRIMMNGKTADMLEPIVMNIYTDQNRDVAKTVLYGVGNVAMEENDKSRVTELLRDYLNSGENELKPVALQSLAALVADDENQVTSLFNQYLAKDYSDDIRYTAVEALYNLEVDHLEPDIENRLTEIANDSRESYYLRSIAMRLLGNYVESREKDRDAVLR